MIFWALAGGVLVLAGILHLLDSSSRNGGRKRGAADTSHASGVSDSGGDATDAGSDAISDAGGDGGGD